MRPARRSREADRMEARICMPGSRRVGGTIYHRPEDPRGAGCRDCAEAREAALSRCRPQHETAATYRDGNGVERLHCCYLRKDGQAE